VTTLGLSIPLLDEQDGCAREARALAEALDTARIPHHIVLVNNGSSDGTPDIIEELARELPGVSAHHLEVNAGYGGGILAGLTQLDTDWQGWHWGDGQIRPAIVVAACRRMAQGDVDLVKARRVQRDDGWQRWAISTGYNRVACPALGVHVPDVNGCPKIFTRQALAKLAPRSSDWLLDLEVMLGAQRAGLAIAQIEATMHVRVGGASKVKLATVAEFLKSMALARIGRAPWERDRQEG
jgi:glycosyltransferase involved in cell wall biosynthesis